MDSCRNFRGHAYGLHALRPYPSPPGLSTRIASSLAAARGFWHQMAPWPVGLSHVGVPTTIKRKETTMFVLRTLRSVIGDCVRVINFGAKIQEPARAQLVQSLKEICGRCDDTYSKLLVHLGPIKASLHRPAKLAVAIRTFASSAEVRSLFKPERLCGEVDDLLTRLESNLDPLKYSLDVTRIQAVRDQLNMIGNYDAAIRAQFDQFVSNLDDLAIRLEEARGDARKELAVYLRNIIKDFEAELKATVSEVRKAKDRIVR
jgi:hypothetical protein